MNIDPQETLGQRIRRLRLEKGMAQSEVADGYVTISMISQLERDKNTASVYLLQHIAKKLHVPLTIAAMITARDHPYLAIQQLQECADNYKESNNLPDLLLSYSKIAQIHIQNRNLHEASQIIDLATQVAADLTDQQIPSMGEFFQTCSRYELLLQNHGHSIEFALKSAGIFGTIGLLHDQVDSLQVVCEAYQSIGDYKTAFETERACTLLLKKINERSV
ncbi:hypothetical protein CBW65_18700 [Tumebacillus avium]|uniref:HTH cro/C1-type domain-containing protein n=1 Tax=Tumebacillus avium TaxID=1903704 RepID=A0A1Y0IQ94_9BACL|nr:helix-turn-helix transcriptional regulator [Tumebacillus avium]ARU62772.1 hypothetical protein CBW65_18700 [Tumebacillus avium]